MRKLALLVPLILAATSCQTPMTWEGSGSGLTEQQRALGIKDVAALNRDYETRAYFRNLRRRMDGTSNAFARDLNSIQSSFGRHFLNYSEDDPYVNHPTDQTSLGHLGRFGLTFVGSVFR